MPTSVGIALVPYGAEGSYCDKYVILKQRTGIMEAGWGKAEL